MKCRAIDSDNRSETEIMLSFFRKNGLVILAIAVVIGIYLFQASHLRGWLIDDAGISFSYARNLAHGFGLVSQPGFPPVEGFSNPTWVFLLSIFARAGLDIAEVAKPLSMVLTAISISILYLAFLRLVDSKILALIAIAGLIVQPAFVIWSVSGLENPLLVMLIVILFYVCILPPTPVLAGLAGMVTGLIALSRPDGVLYIPVYAVLHPKYFKQTLIPSLVIWGSYFIFRLVYFGNVLPNTYFMKAEGKLLSKYWLLAMWGRFKSLLLGLFGPKYLVAATGVVILILLILLLRKRRIDRRYLVVGLFLVISLGIYLFLPTDWMGEYRFASPLFPFFYVFIVLIFADIFHLFKNWKVNPSFAASAVLVLWLAVVYFVSYAPRLEKFVQDPSVSFYGVRADFYRFAEYARILDLDHPSVLLPDVGGALYFYPDIQIYDLGGLVDATIGRTLGRDQLEFYDYVFDSVKPDFIHVHGGWTYAAKLEDDPRFRQDYVAIFEYIDQAMVSNYGEERYSGDFLRRSLLKTPDELELLQAVER